MLKRFLILGISNNIKIKKFYKFNFNIIVLYFGFKKANMSKRQLTGIIISNKMEKTIVVKTERIKVHPKYKRRYKIHKKYKAHYNAGEFNLGDKVIIQESRPLSKDKRWIVIKKV